ncbi:MAG: hypothetical protein R6W72_10370 [Desulfurivibrionaceae bacterium]
MAFEKYTDAKLLREILNVIPSLLFVVDEDVAILDYNATAAEFMKGNRESILKRRGGDVLNCLHATETAAGCGHGPSCGECEVRNSVAEAFHGRRVVRRRTKLEIIRNGEKAEIYALITASSFSFEGKQRVLLLIEDISEIAELRRMIPICSVCHEIRDEGEAWNRIEDYFKEHWDLDFSHGLCPKCYEIEIAKLLNP